MIPYGHQDITQADIDAVVRVLRSDYLTQGPAVPRFEEAVASRVGATHAVAVNSATSALHIACLALGLGPGDWLWTVPNTFVASANCGRYCGAQVDFVDIDPLTWNMGLPALTEKLQRAEQAGRLPKVVVPVHFAGQPPDQQAIWALAQQYGFKVLEDASHAVGAARNGEPVGSCRWSHITVFSFHPVKIVTSGEGGMALTNHADLAAHMRMLRSHGITRELERFLQRGAPDRTDVGPPDAARGAWYYEQRMLGFNYRITDIQAALGASQLERLTDYLDRRNTLAGRYQRALHDLPLRLPSVRPENRSAFHLYVVRLIADSLSVTHGQVFADLRRQGIGVNLHYMPVHLQPYYRELGFVPGQFPEAEAHGREAITLPLFAGLSDQAQDEVVSCVVRALQRLA
jgi:UDP-4-amino-4,6-dideoxy-N-acetyl-beta-L-altrosamine transaminase